KETEPRKALMELGVRVTNYLNKQARAPSSSSQASAAKSAPSSSGGPAHTYDIRKSTEVYKSIYTDEDAKLVKGPRVFKEDPVLPSVSNLVLKGIFYLNAKTPMAILNYESASFTARNGGLYYQNRTLVKNIMTKVLQDRVIVTGPDKIPREIKFKSSL